MGKLSLLQISQNRRELQFTWFQRKYLQKLMETWQLLCVMSGPTTWTRCTNVHSNSAKRLAYYKLFIDIHQIELVSENTDVIRRSIQHRVTPVQQQLFFFLKHAGELCFIILRLHFLIEMKKHLEEVISSNQVTLPEFKQR